MAIPAAPTNVYVQQGNGQVYLSWDAALGATSYAVLRSTDNVTFASVGTPSVPNFLDTTVTVNTQYYYQVQSVNISGSSSPSTSQGIIPTATGFVSLGSIRLQAQQRADRVNSNFVTLPEWNTYINQSALELYDLLVTVYEDYFKAPDYQITTDGVNSKFALPADFYKLLGTDLGLDASNNARVTVNKFDFIQRNRYVFPNVTSTFFGVFNLRYRVMGANIEFIPLPSGNQVITLFYIPRLKWLLQDTDAWDSISGWVEYIIVDAAIKALQKEESDVSILMAQKQMLKQRIEESAQNRDAGQGDTISPTRSNSNNGGYGGPGWDGQFGGY